MVYENMEMKIRIRQHFTSITHNIDLVGGRFISLLFNGANTSLSYILIVLGYFFWIAALWIELMSKMIEWK